MIQLAFAILLFGNVCSAYNLNNIYNFDEDNDLPEFDLTKNLELPENDKDDFEDFDAEFEDERGLGEIEAIQGHVKYQDAARATLLKFAAELRKGKNVTNAFLKVIDRFEKGIAEFHVALRRRKLKPKTLGNIKDFIKDAAKDRKANTKILRELTSQGLFMAERLGESGRKRSDLLSIGAEEFLESIKEEIGEEAFDEYLSISGLVTLMFAIDDTGSMGGEIRAAIAISEQIVNTQRDYEVDYILSPFNDPGTGPLTIKSETEGAEFLTALRALRAHGGDDCPELAFKGMIDALESGPQPGSSMFVFTDAPPKDATEDNKNLVRDLALDLDVKINFFATRGCGHSDAFQTFNDVASDTGGLVYPLKSTVDLKQLGKLVSNSLEGTVSVGSGGNGGSSSGRRRRATSMEYSISVDDSIEKISISVTTQNSGIGISLIDPTGKVVNVGRVDLTNGVVYNIESPITGVYKLIVPGSAGKHKYRVNGVSGINVDFGHYYVAIAKRGTRIPIPLDQPLQGIPAKAFITVAGAESVKPGSLRIKIVDGNDTIHADQPLTAVGTSGVRYFVRFNPPSGPFKLQLYGQTLKGSSFVRESPSQDQTVPVLQKLSYKEDSNILHRGQTTQIPVRIIRGETGQSRQKYKFKITDERSYGSVYRVPRYVYRGRQGFARIKFVVPADAPAGKTENVKLSLTRDGETNPVASLMFSFLIV